MIGDYYSVLDLYRDTVMKLCDRYVEPIINKNTNLPVCPWCGREQLYYETAATTPNDIFCCKEDVDKCYKVIKHLSSYSTHKLTITC